LLAVVIALVKVLVTPCFKVITLTDFHNILVFQFIEQQQKKRIEQVVISIDRNA